MANPLIPNVSTIEQDLLYRKLSTCNQRKASFKEAGTYPVVLPRADYPRCSFRVYSPLPERQSIFYILDLNEGIHKASQVASTLCYHSLRPLLLAEYSVKRMQNRGDDIISPGRYHGHYLHEILRIDPGHLIWIAPKFTSRVPRQECFVQIVGVYHSVYIDVLQRGARQPSTGHFLDKKRKKVESLTLTVLSVHLENDSCKTQTKGTTLYFYVRQVLRLKDASDNLIIFRVNSRTAGRYPCQLPVMEYTYQVDETVYIASARIAAIYAIGKNKRMQFYYIKLRQPG